MAEVSECDYSPDVTYNRHQSLILAAAACEGSHSNHARYRTMRWEGGIQGQAYSGEDLGKSADLTSPRLSPPLPFLLL